MLLILEVGAVLKLRVSFLRHFSLKYSEGEDRDYRMKTEGAISRQKLRRCHRKA